MTLRTASALCAALALSCAGHRRASSGAVQVKLALARELAERGQKDAAFEVADAACRQEPEDGAARALRGSLLAERGLLVEAEADLRDAVRWAPDLPEAHAGMAMVHERQGRAEDAEGEHRRALELSPGNARYLNNLGYALLAHGKPAEALPVLLEAARVDPLSRRVRSNLGFAHAALGDYPRASRAFELGGTPAEAQNNLGLAYERAGNLAQAREHYAQALRLDPQLAVASANLAHLDAPSRPEAQPDPGPAPRTAAPDPERSPGGQP